MATRDASRCAACGKGGAGLKACTACKQVKYCNATCQRAHWPRHKHECKKRAAEIFDEALFKERPRDECPICLLPLPLADNFYQTCCSKIVCDGCILAMEEEALAQGKTSDCPFCRTPDFKSFEELNDRMKKRVESNDAMALFRQGSAYNAGLWGMPVDRSKALELWFRAGELGCADANHFLGIAYESGEGVKANGKKTKYHWELAAIGGNIDARYDLGFKELQAGNVNRGLKHFMIAARAGHEASLKKVTQGFLNGAATKDEYERTLRAYQESKDEMKSEMREKAAGSALFW